MIRSPLREQNEASVEKSLDSGRTIHKGIGFAHSRADDRADDGRPGDRAGHPEVREKDDRMRRKLLVVDDDPYLTTQLRKLLESDELSVDTVSSAQEALTALGETDYSVLITDLKMPGMGGMELIREVAQRRVMG